MKRVMASAIAAFAACLTLAACAPKSASDHPSNAAPTPPQQQNAATSVAAAPTALPGAGPPMTDGLYVLPGACPGEGCELGAWVATRVDDLRARPDQNAPVVAHVAEGENVDAVDSLLRLKPVRGVVFRADQGLEVGDVVYMLDSQGEGFMTLWRRGEALTWSWPSEDRGTVDETTGVHWDRPEAEWQTPPAPGPFEGWWVEIKGADGQVGWTRNNDAYQCRPVEGHPEHCQLM